MKPEQYKALTLGVLPVVIILMVVGIVAGIMKPIKFEEQRKARESVGIQRLKDIRTLETLFKSENGRYTDSADTLKMFYTEGTITVEMQMGSADDSASVAYTSAVKKQMQKKNPRIKLTDEVFAAQCSKLYNEMKEKGDSSYKLLVFTIKTAQPVRKTVFLTNEGRSEEFNIDSTFIIPFCGQPVIMRDTVKEVSGVPVPLFEACMPYKAILKGLDNQLRINLDFEREKLEKYKGLKVGDIEKANNNAGNWE